MADAPQLRIDVRRKQRELSARLDRWDPIGVYADEGGPPPGEYDCLLKILGQLKGGASVEELGALLAAELRDHFGINPAPADPARFAGELHRWYWEDPLPGSRPSL